MRFGSSTLKARIWDKEYRDGNWDRIDNTSQDVVYPHLEKYSRNGSILDLGCGPGNTANEVANDKYTSYVGLDIAEAALVKARKRSEENGRGHKNTFVQGDFLAFVPQQQFDVILMREAMYHVPQGALVSLLKRLSQYLKPGGVFIVGMCLERKNGEPHPRLMALIETIEAGYDVIEKQRYGRPGVTVTVFRPRSNRQR
jgi:2-polyprenyl-3-methyl-5-hydroxy-6-metoxy-1,4-benzoquinol methylase